MVKMSKGFIYITLQYDRWGVVTIRYGSSSYTFTTPSTHRNCFVHEIFDMLKAGDRLYLARKVT